MKKVSIKFLILTSLITSSYAMDWKEQKLRDVKSVLVEKDITVYDNRVDIMEEAEIKLNWHCRSKADGRAVQKVTSKRCIKMKEEFVYKYYKCLAICTYAID